LALPLEGNQVALFQAVHYLDAEEQVWAAVFLKDSYQDEEYEN